MSVIDKIRNALARKLHTGAPGVSNRYESGQGHSPRRGPVPGSNPRDGREELTSGTRQQIVKASRHVGQNYGYKEENAQLFQIYAVGEGMRPQATTENKDWNDEAEGIFNDWARNPDITGRFNLTLLQHLWSRAIDFDGEIFVIKTRDRFDVPRLQTLETHRFSTKTDAKKRLYDGIEYNAVSGPRWYHLLKQDPKNRFSMDTRRVPAGSIIHIYDPTSVSLSRQPPSGQHGLNYGRDVLELNALMTHKVKDHAGKSMVLTSDRPNAAEDSDLNLNSEDLSDLRSDADAIAKQVGGEIIDLYTNEDLKAMQSAEPHANFHNHIEHLERDQGGMGYELVRNAKDLGGATVRLFVSKAGRKINHRQMILERANNAVWFFIIGNAINSGELAPMPRWHLPTWTRTKSITVDAGREAQANREALILGSKLLSAEVSEHGGDFDEHIKRRAMEARKIMQAAGIPDTEPIPIDMIWNPGGTAPESALISENARAQ